MRLKLICISFMMVTVPAFAAENSDSFARNYIDASIGEPAYYLYKQATDIRFNDNQKYRAINIGSGTGDVVVDMLSKGWDVTATDKAQRAKEVADERTKNLKGSFQFQLADIPEIRLTGDYNLAVAFYTLPFGKKENVPTLIKDLSAHMKKGSLVAVNFFGNDHSLVKDGVAFGLTEKEVRQYFSDNQFKVIYYLNRVYDTPGDNDDSDSDTKSDSKSDNKGDPKSNMKSDNKGDAKSDNRNDGNNESDNSSYHNDIIDVIAEKM